MKDWRTLLYECWDKNRMKRLVEHISTDENTFIEVFHTFCDGKGREAHRSGFILGSVFKKEPTWLLSRIDQLLTKMQQPPHEWYRWHVLWYLSHCKFPTEHDGLAATYAFEELGKSCNKPAIKNCSMRLLEKICMRNPELIPEYKLYLDEIIENERPTLKRQAQKQMKTLSKWELKTIG